MKIKVKDILKACNISDSWCETKLARLNDILSMFTATAFELYPLKHAQGFDFTNCETVIDTKYPIARVWWFVTNCKCAGCSMKPLDCCEWWSKLLINQWFYDELDNNMYAVDYENNKVKVKTSISQWRWILIYSRALPIVTSLDEEIEIDRYTLALLRQFIKMDYALDAQNDTTLNKYYSNRLESRIEAVNKLFANHILFVQPGWVQIKYQQI